MGSGHGPGRDAGTKREPMTALLDIRDLSVAFDTDEGAVRAVRGVTYSIEEGEVLGVVGESGSGKSVHALAIMRLIPVPPGRMESGEIRFGGEDLLRLDRRQMRSVRGKRISMVFQDPMSSLNPVYTVGFQIRGDLAPAPRPRARGGVPAGRSNSWTSSGYRIPASAWRAIRTSYPAACASG